MAKGPLFKPREVVILGRILLLTRLIRDSMEEEISNYKHGGNTLLKVLVYDKNKITQRKLKAATENHNLVQL